MLDAVFLIAAVVGGTIMVCQFLLTLLGMGGDEFGDADAGHFEVGHGDVGHGGVGHGDVGHGDVGHADAGDGVYGDHHNQWGDVDDPSTSHPNSSWLFGVVSFRTLVAATAFFGIAGITANTANMPQAAALVIALAAGFAAMYGTYYMLRSITRLNSDGNERIVNAVGRHAKVYIPIPASRAGMGKVQFTMQNRTVEFPAVTDDPAPLKTGDAVEVVAVNGTDTVEVTRIAAPVEA